MSQDFSGQLCYIAPESVSYILYFSFVFQLMNNERYCPGLDTYILNSRTTLNVHKAFKWVSNCYISLLRLFSFVHLPTQYEKEPIRIWCTVLKLSVFRAFLVRIFSHLNWTRRDTEYLSLFSPNVGKYGIEKLRIGHFWHSDVDLN